MGNPKKAGFEEHLAELESIVDDLESGDLTLDDSMARFTDGVKRLKACTKMLEAAEKQVRILVDGPEPHEEPFASEGE